VARIAQDLFRRHTGKGRLLLSAVPLLAGLLPAPVQAQCVFCFSDVRATSCYNSSYSGSCVCNVRCRVAAYVNICLCVESGVCSSNDPYSGPYCDHYPLANLEAKSLPAGASAGVEVDASSFPKLGEKDPILGELLRGATQVREGRTVLSLDPWLEGFLRYDDTGPGGGGMRIYHSSAIFYPGKDGQVTFRFVLVDVDNGSSLSYTGRLSEAGRQVSYSATRREKTGKETEHTSAIQWRSDGAPPIMRNFVPVPPPPTLPVDPAAFRKLAEKDLILGELLGGATREPADGKAVLSLEPWQESFLRLQGVSYHTSAVFYPKANGQVTFRFVLLNVESGSSLSYTGRLSDSGRRVSYSTTRRDKTGRELEHTPAVEWRCER
jgi:hypothetical protein